jgi:hypothetical protein
VLFENKKCGKANNQQPNYNEYPEFSFQYIIFLKKDFEQDKWF